MSSPTETTLMDMGFSRQKVLKALQVTGNAGVEPAMEWLLAHGDDIDVQEMETSTPEANTAESNEGAVSEPSTSEPPEEAKSLKCDECGKLFRTQEEVEFHAAKSGHSQFSESTEEKKPLSEEEKKAQLKLLEEKLASKKREREEKEKQEALEREKNRIKAGKEMIAIRKKMEDEELKKVLDQRKREKEEDRLARQKVKEQIEADRLARKAKSSNASSTDAPVAAPAPQPIPESPSKSASKNYTETRIQVRLTNGQTITQTFSSKEQLSAVRLYVEMNRSDATGPFTLMTNFPKKVFSGDDFDQPLDVLGLVPSAVLIVKKSTEMQYD